MRTRLVHLGKMRKRENSDLVGCLKELIPSQKNTVVTSSPAEVVILGVAVNVNFLSPDNANTFSDYAS